MNDEELTQQVFADAAASLQARERMTALAVAAETRDYGPELAAALHAAIEHHG